MEPFGQINNPEKTPDHRDTIINKAQIRVISMFDRFGGTSEVIKNVEHPSERQ